MSNQPGPVHAVLLPLSKLIGVAYIALAVVLFVLFPLIALFLRISIFEVYKLVWDLMLIGASTGSTESVLPQLMLRVEKFGVPKYITSFVIPAGMPLNSDGSVLYLCVAGLFIAQIYNIPMSFSHQMFMVMIFVITSKGVAAVPSSTMVIILAMCSVVGLPPQGVALILGVDRVIDMARTMVNVIGRVFSCVAVAKWEGVFRTDKPDEFDQFIEKLEPETV
jgi:proton glutamate symport protein